MVLSEGSWLGYPKDAGVPRHHFGMTFCTILSAIPSVKQRVWRAGSFFDKAFQCKTEIPGSHVTMLMICWVNSFHYVQTFGGDLFMNFSCKKRQVDQQNTPNTQTEMEALPFLQVSWVIADGWNFHAQVRIPFPRSLCLRMHLGETPQKHHDGPKKHQTPNHQRKSCWNKHRNI